MQTFLQNNQLKFLEENKINADIIYNFQQFVSFNFITFSDIFIIFQMADVRM